MNVVMLIMPLTGVKRVLSGELQMVLLGEVVLSLELLTKNSAHYKVPPKVQSSAITTLMYFQRIFVPI